MDATLRFRAALAGRIVRILGLATLTVPAAHMAGCGGKVFLDVNGSGGGGGDAGGAGGSGGGCELTTTGTSGDGVTMQWTTCFSASPCPAGSSADAAIQNAIGPCDTLQSIDCGPVVDGGQCCYVITSETTCVEGRPFVVAGEARTARPAKAPGWSAADVNPDVVGLTEREREALGDHFTRAALYEHASIAAFSRLSLELLAVGAPAEIVEGAHLAALDEVRHAELCFAIAGAVAAHPVGPSAFPFEGTGAIGADLAEIAAATVREGCVGETLAAVVAAEELAAASDPAVRAVLATIAKDEARHAEIAFRTVAWAVDAGGERVRRAVAEAFAAASMPPAEAEDDPSPTLQSYGILPASTRRAAMARALDDVVRPCGCALLERRAAASEASAIA